MPAASWMPASPTCRSGWWAVARFGLSVALLSLAFSLLALPWLDLSWWKIVRRCVSIAAAVSLWWCIRRVEGRPFSAYGLRGGREARRMIGAGLLVAGGLLLLLVGLGLATGACVVDLHPDRAKLWGTVLGFIPAALLVAVLEELVFRGYLFRHLLGCSPWLAVTVSSALYAVAHVREMLFNAAIGRELAGLLLLGAVLALTVLWTQQLSWAIGLHAALAYGARVNKLIISIPDSPLSWFTGTSRLVNGVAAWIALGGMAACVWWWTHRTQQGGQQHATG